MSATRVRWAADVAIVRDRPAGDAGTTPSGAYMLAFAVPVDTPGCYVRAVFAMYGLPRGAADAFFADVSSAIRDGREDLLISEERLVRNAVSEAFTHHQSAIAMKPFLEAELVALLASGRSAA
ncbi:MAG: hypothetical protein IAI48_06780 [Candidatus Eremiobacteraeota bacterium]|nr:hypothetical protein [Candidatus Eremiobacteraeota bacterium]